MTKLAPEWVRTNDPVIRSPARYRWATAPAKSNLGDTKLYYSIFHSMKTINTNNKSLLCKKLISCDRLGNSFHSHGTSNVRTHYHVNKICKVMLTSHVEITGSILLWQENGNKSRHAAIEVYISMLRLPITEHMCTMCEDKL